MRKKFKLSDVVGRSVRPTGYLAARDGSWICEAIKVGHVGYEPVSFEEAHDIARARRQAAFLTAVEARIIGLRKKLEAGKIPPETLDASVGQAARLLSGFSSIPEARVYRLDDLITEGAFFRLGDRLAAVSDGEIIDLEVAIGRVSIVSEAVPELSLSLKLVGAGGIRLQETSIMLDELTIIPSMTVVSEAGMLMTRAFSGDAARGYFNNIDTEVYTSREAAELAAGAPVMRGPR